MAKYNEQKIYEELDKLSINELVIVVGKLKDWTRKKIVEEADIKANELVDLKQKMESI